MQEITINAELRRNHLAALAEEASRQMYDRVLAQCRDRPGGLRASDQDMIFDLCQAEDVKTALREDIRKRGVMVETRNGRQVFKKENPAMARMCRYAELQRKIRADLGLIVKRPADAAAAQEEEDDFGAF